MLHRLRFLRPRVFIYHHPLYRAPRLRPFSSTRLNLESPPPPPKNDTAEDSLASALATLSNLPEYRLKDINVVKKVIKKAAATTDTPHVVYEGVLNFFIRTSRTAQALFVMQRMEALGYTLLNQTVAKLLVLVSAAAEHPPEECVHLILEIVQEEDYTEDNLRDLLHTISSYSIDREKTAQTLFVEAFRAARGGAAYLPGLKMLPTFVAAAVRANRLEDAFAMLASYLSPPSSLTHSQQQHHRHLDRADRAQIFAAWLAFLKALRETRPRDTASYARVLDSMSAHQVSVNVKLFDQVIAHEARLEDWQGAFRVYATLRALSPLAKQPPQRGAAAQRTMRIGTSTFATLFRTYSDMERGVGGPADANPDREMEGILAPRALFRDFTATFPPAPSSGAYHSSQLMHVMLRAFMHQADYAGALVVLRTFAGNGVRLTHATYYVVVKALIGRIWYESRIGRVVLPSARESESAKAATEGVRSGGQGRSKKETTRWAARFLGISTKPVLGLRLVNHILFLVSRREFDVNARMYPASGTKFRDQDEDGDGPASASQTIGHPEQSQPFGGGRLCKVPTMLMMEHVHRPQPLDFKYEVLPLERLLLRAVWADEGRGEEEGVKRAVERAEREMLPPPL